MLHITKYTLNTTYCTQHTIHYTLQIKQKPMHTLSYTLIHFKMYHALYRLWSRRWNVSAKQILAGPLFRQFLQVQQIQGPDNIYWGEPLNNTSGTFLINGLIWGKGSHTYLQIFIETNQHKPNKQTKILPTSVPHSPPPLLPGHMTNWSGELCSTLTGTGVTGYTWHVTCDMWHLTCDCPPPKVCKSHQFYISICIYVFLYNFILFTNFLTFAHFWRGEGVSCVLCHISHL